MKTAIFIVAIIATVFSAIETYLAWYNGYHFSRAVNNFFTWLTILAITIYLYIK